MVKKKVFYLIHILTRVKNIRYFLEDFSFKLGEDPFGSYFRRRYYIKISEIFLR